MEKLGPKFDLSQMLVVDFMHEFELGVWKALFTHLIRVLYAAAPSGRLVAVLDERCDLKITVHVQILKFHQRVGFVTYRRSARQYVDSLVTYLK